MLVHRNIQFLGGFTKNQYLGGLGKRGLGKEEGSVFEGGGGVDLPMHTMIKGRGWGILRNGGGDDFEIRDYGL